MHLCVHGLIQWLLYDAFTPKMVPMFISNTIIIEFTKVRAFTYRYSYPMHFGSWEFFSGHPVSPGYALALCMLSRAASSVGRHFTYEFESCNAAFSFSYDFISTVHPAIASWDCT